MSRSRNQPEKPTPLGHLADLVVFRSVGALLIFNEVKIEDVADWHVLVAGFAMFFMPDALRGKSSIVFRTLAKFAERENTDDREDQA